MSGIPAMSKLSPRGIDVTAHRSIDEIEPGQWQSLWQAADAPSVFTRREWLTAWWRTWSEGRELRIYAAHVDGRLVGLLPTAWPHNSPGPPPPVVLLGDEHADYGAVLVAKDVPEAFAALAGAACRELPRRGSLLLRDIRSDSSHAAYLEHWARQVASKWCCIGAVPCPRTMLSPERVQAIINKDSLRRHTRKLNALGEVSIQQLTEADEILPRLDAFFSQHVERWASTNSPSLFRKEQNRALYRELTRELGGSGALLFTEISLDGVPVAFHFGFVSENDFIWYKPSFSVALSKVSPGEVMIRELFLWAAAQELQGFDFTRGGESFKQRFSDHEREARTYRYFSSPAVALKTAARIHLKRIRDSWRSR